MTVTGTRQKLKPGAVVRCRTRRYLVEDVQAPKEPGADKVKQRNRDLARLDRQAAGPRPFAWCKTRGPIALIRG